jgi:hypothetical protein
VKQSALLRSLLAFVAAAALLSWAGCGGKTGDVIQPPPPTPPQVSITANPLTITAGQSSTLSVSVTNAPPGTSIACSLSVTVGTATTDMGTIACSGGTKTITPGATAKYTVTSNGPGPATSSASVTVTVNAAPPPTPTVTSVAVTPSTASIQTGATQQFAATVVGTNNPNLAVVWSVDLQSGTAVGTISTAGLYAAPATAGTFTVRATSVQDGTKSGTATVTVTAPPPPSPTVTSVTITPATTSAQTGETLSVTWNVVGTNNPGQGVTLSVDTIVGGNTSVGTFTIASGTNTATYTAPATAGTHTLMATSTVDATQSGSVVITVTAPPPTLTTISASPLIKWLDDDSFATAFVEMTITGTGFASGQYACITPNLPIDPTKTIVVNSTQVKITVVYDTPDWRPGLYTIGFTDGTSCAAKPPTSTAPFYFAGDQNMLAITPTGQRFSLNQATGIVSAPDNPSLDSFFAALALHSIAYDAATNTVVVDGATFDATTGKNTISGPSISSTAMGNAADGKGNACVAIPSQNQAIGFPISQSTTTGAVISAGNQPFAAATVFIGAGSSCEIYSRGDTTIHQFSLPDMAPQGNLFLTGLATGGQPEVVALNGGTAAGTIAVFNQADNTVTFAAASVNGPTFIRTIQLDSSLISQPVRIAADPTGGRVIVAYVNPLTPSTLMTAVAIDVATGQKTVLNATSSTAPVGFAIHPTTNQLLVCDASSCATGIPNN